MAKHYSQSASLAEGEATGAEVSPDVSGQGIPRVEVIIEIPRWSFLKRGSTGRVDFISPFPCPFNYGSVPHYVGLDNDLLDAVVLGQRLKRGSRVSVPAIGAIGLSERGLYDDKLICSNLPITRNYRRRIVAFFHAYGVAKWALNVTRGRHGASHCWGWDDAAVAIARARPRDSTWHGPSIPF